MHIYNGDNVFILIDDTNDVFELIKESVIKIIQQRYGINSLCVYEDNDFTMIQSEDSDFSIQGLYNFDSDRNRYLAELNVYGQ